MVNGTKGLMAPSKSHDDNFDNPQKNTTIIGMNYCFLSFQLLVLLCIVWQILYSKKSEQRFRSLIILPACVPMAAAGFLIAVDDATKANTHVFVAMLLLILGTAVARLEIFVTYYRVLEECLGLELSQPAQIVLCLAGVLVAASSIIAWFVLLFACQPIVAWWDLRHSKGAQCIDRYLLHLLQAVPGIVADFTVMAVMLFFCFPLLQSWKKKAALLAQCSSGILLLAPAVARLVVLATTGEDPHTAFVSAPVILCFVIEANLAIIYISIPRVRQGVREQWSQDTASMMNSAMGGRQGGMFREIGSRLGGGDGSTNTTGSVAGDSDREGSNLELIDRTV